MALEELAATLMAHGNIENLCGDAQGRSLRCDRRQSSAGGAPAPSRLNRMFEAYLPEQCRIIKCEWRRSVRGYVLR